MDGMMISVMQTAVTTAAELETATSGSWGLWIFLKILQVLGFVIVLALLVAALVLADRKIWAAVQMRRGPNVVGAFGLLQTIADALKFFFKEIVIPAGSDKFLFILAPLIALVMAFLAWAVIPVAPGWVISDINIGVLYVLAISSLGVYGIMIGGWASNSKYPFMGALRSAAQMVSYEVSIGFIILTVIFVTGSMNLTEIVGAQSGGFWNWNMFNFGSFADYGLGAILVVPILFYMGILFFISALAETNRPPFDLPEAESELVAGYQVEYSSTPFLMFFFAEYVNIMLLSAMMTILFLGGWHAPIDVGFQILPGVFWFFLKTAFIFFLFAMVKAIVPRYRYDQLMRLGWKVFLPTSLVAVLVVSGVVVFTGAA
jgi:NADH-quinone oxidoreductase subunit H